MMCRALFEGLAGRRLVAQVGTYTHDSWLKMIWAVPQFDDLLLRWGGVSWGPGGVGPRTDKTLTRQLPGLGQRAVTSRGLPA